jgi:beta-lactamase regulating signal transducer with metallopeptidase domain
MNPTRSAVGKISQVVPVFLLNALWQAALIYAVASVCARSMRRAPARQQHLLWAAALALSTALPLWTMLRTGQESLSTAPTSSAVTSYRGGEPAVVLQGSSAADGLWKVAFLQNRGGTVSYPTFIAVSLSLCYAVFLLRRSFKLWGAWAESVAVRRGAVGLSQPDLLVATAKRCRAGLGLHDVPVLCSTEVAAPLTTGALRPVVILPARLYTSETSPEILASVVGHEMAHVRRRDFALNLVLELLHLPVSFHPAACLMRRRVRETREIACDELVAARLVEPKTYARALVRLAAEMSRPSSPAHTLGVFDADILEERIMRLVDKRARAGSFARRAAALASAVALGVTCAAASAYGFGVGQESKDKDAARTFPQSSLPGTWHFATPDGKTRVATIDVKSDGEKLAGTFVGYQYDKGDDEVGEKKVVAKLESPLIDPKFDGKALNFKVKVKPPRADLQPMEMEIEMKLTGENEGETRIVGRPEAPALKATREVKGANK